MTADEPQVHQARLFRGFALELVDDQTVDMPRPEFITLTRPRRSVIAAARGGDFKAIAVHVIRSIDRFNRYSRATTPRTLT